MYLTVDIGGTKTLLATFTRAGELRTKLRFETPKNYDDFLTALSSNFSALTDVSIEACAVAVPGKLDREKGMALAYGNLPWPNVHIAKDIKKIVDAPVIIENDSKLAGLSEAKLIIDDFKKSLYITISTGINVGLIIDGHIDEELADSEAGHIMLERNGKIQPWESFASGQAIQKKYGRQAREITEVHIWKEIVHNMAIGLLDLIAVIQPEVIIVGGGVGTHFKRFGKLLEAELEKYSTPLTPTPALRQAQRPEDAVLYGCYELLRQKDRGRAT